MVRGVREVREVRVLREERRPHCDVIGGNSDAENPFVMCGLLLRSFTLFSSEFHLHMRSSQSAVLPLFM